MAGTVMMFPGQGSQKVGMGVDLVERHPDLRQEFFAAADAILDLDLTRLCFEGPEEDLRRTENTQPAVFTVSMATLAALRREGIDADAAAGHSLGEYSALVCADVLDFEDALRLVRRRGELMAAVNERTPGAMAAIMGLPPDAIDSVCADVRADGHGIVEPANYNEPEQTVISGEAAAVEEASGRAKEAGAGRVIPLQVGAPFHCSLMSELTEEFASELERYAFRDPAIPVVANVTGDLVRTAAEVKDALRRQVAGSVRWTDTLRRLARDGNDVFIEVGPGRVLSGFSMKVNPDLAVHSTADGRRFDRLLAAQRA